MNKEDFQDEIVRDPHQAKLVLAAAKMGIEAEDLRGQWRMDAVRFHFQNEAAIVFDGRSYPSLTAQADIICIDKNITKTIYYPMP